MKDVKQDYIEHKLNERWMSVIIEILLVLDFLGVKFDYEITSIKLFCYYDKFNFFTITDDMQNICKLAF